MGCDIHLYVEAKVWGKWIALKRIPGSWNYLYKEYHEVLKRKINNEPVEPWQERMYNEWKELVSDGGVYEWAEPPRWYELFSILADVRNFDEPKFNPISKPKGLPDDVSDKVWELYHEAADAYYPHSESYLTLRELLEFDWEQEHPGKRGYVDAENYMKWKTGQAPDYCSVSFKTLEQEVTHDQMEKYILGQLKFDKNPVTLVTWNEKYKDCAGVFYSKIIPALINECEVITQGNPDELRIVFWFDN